MHPNAVAVVEAARGCGLEIDPLEFPEGTRTAAEAADAVGTAVDQIVKTLAFRLVDQPGAGPGAGPAAGRVVLALVGGADRLDEARLAAVAGAAAAERADADEVRAATGYPIGGVPPFGHPEPLETWVDDALLAHPQVWAAAGTPRHVFAVAPADLVRASGATVAHLRR